MAAYNTSEDKDEEPEKRPEWMTSISSLVNPDDYLLGRKIDKTFELSQKEKAQKAKDARIELLAQDKIKLRQDPILELERRKRELKMELIRNPVLLKQFRDRLSKGECHQDQSSRQESPPAAHASKSRSSNHRSHDQSDRHCRDHDHRRRADDGVESRSPRRRESRGGNLFIHDVRHRHEDDRPRDRSHSNHHHHHHNHRRRERTRSRERRDKSSPRRRDSRSPSRNHHRRSRSRSPRDRKLSSRR